MSKKIVQPISGILLVVVGVLVGFKIKAYTPADEPNKLSLQDNLRKFETVVRQVRSNYFEEVDVTDMVENAIVGMLDGLDPHTFYIPPPDMKAISEQMRGSFEGIGIEFNIMEDTLLVVTPISGGPSEKLGIMPGDRIIKVEGENVAGIGLSNRDVVEMLRGEKGTVVSVTIYRPGMEEFLEFDIERDKIPLNSVDFAYMPTEDIGYIKVNRFSETTMQEFMEKLYELKEQGMRNLILDLRNNPGGYLEMAQMMADMFLEKGQMIVYTEGRIPESNKKYVATSRFKEFEEGGLIVLINQGSASASEIVSGSVQDHDRGLIIGNRSFGKGLVQQQYQLVDGSAIRVVISRYFTPAGRCIQKPFNEDSEDYNREIWERFESGELFSADSIKFPDSLKYKTDHGRVVYGGGGIMPDVFIPADTSGRSDYLEKLITKNLLRQFAFRYSESHDLKSEYANGMDFADNYEPDQATLDEFIGFSEERGVEYDEQGYTASLKVIKQNLKALIGRQLYGDEGFYPSLHVYDPAMQKALNLMPDAVKLAETGEFSYSSSAR